MSNNNESETKGKKLNDLRVVELKAELQKRNEDTNGIKAVLMTKLSNALEKEGHNPEEYLFAVESSKRTTSKRSIGSRIAEDSDEVNDSMDGSNEKTGYEASDIIEDALKLAVDDELKDEREDMNVNNCLNVNINSSQNEVNSKCNEDSTPEDLTPMLSPPKPETAPVIAPLTIEDKFSMTAETAKHKSVGTDDTSLIVNLDDSQSDIMDGELDLSDQSVKTRTKNSNENKSIRKSNNDTNNSFDSKSESVNESKTSNNEELSNSSAKDMNKISEKDSSKAKSSSNQKENKLKNKDSKTGCNIWVSGLSQNISANDLKTLFLKHGKLINAKIIKNAQLSGSRCYGYLTMETIEDVSKCIQALNKYVLHGRAITLSRNRPQESTSKQTVARNKANPLKRDVIKKASNSKESDNKEPKPEDKTDDNNKTKNSVEKHPKKTVSESGSKTSETKDISKRKPIRPPFRDRPLPSFPRPYPFARQSTFQVPFRRPVPTRRGFIHNSPSFRGGFRGGFSRGGMRPPMMMNRPDVDRNIRERERERRIREERRRGEELMRVERTLEREERIKFEREKERLKLERLRLEREKAEFFKVERERARLEREKIEREREELRRRQQNQTILQNRVEDTRTRSTIVSSTLNKRPFESRGDSFWEERKRLQQMQRVDSHIMPGRQAYMDSNPSIGNRHSVPHSSYDNRNDSFKRNTRFEPPMTSNSRSDFETRRHDSRQAIGHDRDERKSGSGPAFYRPESVRNTSFVPRDKRITSQREDWRGSHDSRRSDRYSDKPMTSGSPAVFGNNRYGGDTRGWGDRASNSLNKSSYGSGGLHQEWKSGGQQWNPSGNRWNSAMGSNDSRNRSQNSLSASMITGSTSINDLFGSNPMPGMALNISHSMGSNSGNNSGDRYLHSNRRF